MEQITRIGMDTSKHIFTLHGVDEQDHVIPRCELRRGQVEAFFSKGGTLPSGVSEFL